MVELESRFEVQGKKLLVVGWFEGSGTGRITVDGPNKGEREEVQVASLDASLLEEVQEAMNEPPPPVRQGAVVMAHITLSTDGSRQRRSMELKGGTRLDALCVKLLSMADMMAQGQNLKKVIVALKARCG